MNKHPKKSLFTTSALFLVFILFVVPSSQAFSQSSGSLISRPLLAAPEIEVQGNGTLIPNGDTTPDTLDDTDFGTAEVAGTPVSHTFTIYNSGDLELNLTGGALAVVVSGDHPGDFTVIEQPSTPVAASGTTTFTVEFAPSAAGLRSALISIANDDLDENPYTFSIQGTGETLPESFSKLSPSNGANPVPLTPTLSWESSTGTDKYEYCYDTVDDDTCTGWTDNGNLTTVTLPTLTAGGIYYWQVRAVNDLGLTYADDLISDYWMFVVGAAPGAFVKISPADGAEDQATNPVISWGASDGATGYAYCYDESGDGACATWVNVGNSTSASINGLTPGGTYYWQVRATNDFGTTYADSETYYWMFTVAPAAVAPEIDVEGNGSQILSGDTSPSVADGTDFGSLSITGATVTHTFYIYNLGDGDLTLTNTPYVTITGNHAADFSVITQPTSPVAPAGSTTFSVTFDPSAAGLRSAVIQIANNDSDEPLYNFSIQGTGTVAPEMDVKGNEISIPDGDGVPAASDGTDFGSTLVNGGTVTHNFTIYNTGDGDLLLLEIPQVVITGNNAGDFTVTLQPTSPIAPLGSATFSVQFNPSAAGLRTAELSIANSDSDENPYNFSLQGSGLVYPEMDVRGNDISIASGDILPSTADGTDFGSTAVAGGTVSHTFTILNTGDGDLNLTGTPKVAVGGVNAGDFLVTTQPASPVAPAGSTTFVVVFDPSAGGLRTATLLIANDDSDESPYYFAIQGTGTVAPEIELRGNSVVIMDGDGDPSLSDWTDFGSTPVAAGTISRTFTINNLGDGPLALTGNPLVLLEGANAGDFSVTVLPSSTVAAGGSTSFTVVFDPSAAGLRSASISIANDDLNENPYNFSIQGAGTVAAEMEVRGNAIPIANGDDLPEAADGTDFGSTPVAGGTVTHSFTIHNLGDGDLVLNGNPLVLILGSNPGDFTVTVDPLSPVVPGGSTSFTVVFNPSASGLRSAIVSIANSDADENPYTFSLQGTGTVFPEVEVRGNGFTILIGDSSPTAEDGTDFGSTLVDGGTVTHSFTIHNLGDGNLDLSGSPRVAVLGANPGDFTVSVQPGSPVAPGGSTSFSVVFDPTAGGLRSAVISIANNDTDENPYTFSIQGTSIVPPEMDVRGNSISIMDGDSSPSTTDGTDFGSAAVMGAIVLHTFTIYNTGAGDLILSGSPLVAISGTNAADFTVSVQPSSVVAPGGSTSFTVVFNPSGVGTRSAALSIANNDLSEHPYNFSLQGTGVTAPEMEVRGNTLQILDNDTTPSLYDGTDFGEAAVAGGTVTHTFTINNLGDANLNLSGTPRVAVSGANAAEFSVTVQPSSFVTPGGSTTFTVVFNPSASGLRSAALSIANNDANENPYNFNLQGMGVNPPGAFTKLLPANGTIEVTTSPVLSWSDSTEVGYYEYCYDTTNDNTCTTWINNGKATSVGLSGLSSVTPYYWHVRAVNIAGMVYSNSLTVAFWNFTTTWAVSPDFFRNTPLDGATDQPLDLSLTWGVSAGATSYEYCIDTSDDDACTTWINVGDVTSVALSGLREETTYYWHVRANNSGQIIYAGGSATTFWRFTTGDFFMQTYLPVVRK